MVSAKDAGLLAIRLAFGLGIAAHGTQKLFGWFGGGGREGTAGFFESVGFTPPDENAVLAGATELGAGAAIAAGLATGPAGAALAGTMAVASSVHGYKPLWAQAGGPEMSLAYGVVGAALTVSGAGALSLDAVTGRVLDRPWLRVCAVLAAAGGAAWTIAQRRAELARRAESPATADEATAAAEASDPSI